LLPGGRIELPEQTVRDLMGFAFGVQDEQIIRAPKWAGEERFDIVAKAPSTPTPELLRRMMQKLLAERFQLATHNEDRKTSSYVLILARNPPGIRETAGGQANCHWTEASDGRRRRECRNMTMEEFARELPDTGGIGIFLPVKDQTGLKGRYDFEFEVGSAQRRPSPEASGDASLPAAEDSGPSIFSALIKLGLRLEERKVMMPAVVVDGVERP
jgi:uncharacterized protein (TIGR03435 family)